MFFGYFWGDWTILIVIPALIFTLWAQTSVNSAYRRYSQVRNASGLTGADAARRILNANGLVRQPIVTKLFLKFRHYDEITKKNKETGEYYKEKIQYQAGNYFLDINSGIEANIEEIIVRNNYAKDTVRLTFPEGWSIARIFKKIESTVITDEE